MCCDGFAIPWMFWALGGLSLLAAVVFAVLPESPAAVRSVIKTTAVGSLAALAALSGAGWLALALAASALGDFALSRPGDRAFLAGMISFGAAHALYVGLFVWAGAEPRFALGPLLGAVILFSIGLKLGGAYSARAGDLAVAVRIYVGLIVLMAVAASFIPKGPGVPLIGVGALAFVVSDALLGQQVFLKRLWRGQSFAIWSTYYAAQVLLFAGLLQAA